MIELLLSQILNGVVIGAVYALIALGFTLVFGVANIINFAQGALLMLGAFAYLHQSERLQGRFDFVGAALSVAGMVATVYGFIHGDARPAAELTSRNPDYVGALIDAYVPGS